jgi:predicted nucleic acid-binding protein
MMLALAYVDTSALAKRFVNELRSLDMEQFLVAGSHRCVLSSLSLTELKAVLRRRSRSGDITEAMSRLGYAQVLQELARGTWQYQPVGEAIFTLAGELADRLDSVLGTLDAIHLAGAKAANCQLMVSADRQLLRASRECGLETLDLS